VEVHDDDTKESLSARVLEEEHRWYPRVIQWIIEGRVKRIGRNVNVDRSDN
jgi:phosphoribosylglycinamide formyltransferase-1